MARTNFKPWQYGDRESVTEMRKRIFDGQMEAQKARREEESWYVKDSRITALDNDPVDSPVTARPSEKKRGVASSTP